MKTKKLYEYETCKACDGEGKIPPCCAGMPHKIECACHGEEKECDVCDGKGRYKVIQRGAK